MAHFKVLSLFPEMFEAITASGITSRAVKEGLLKVDVINPREFTEDRHRTVDDRPYGGGPGMLMLIEPLLKALSSAKAQFDSLRLAQIDDADHDESVKKKPWVVYLSPQGKVFDQQVAKELAEREEVILIAGRYEGVDQRFIDLYVDQEISLGDFVVSGGELPAMMVIDAASRCIPGVLGHDQSAHEDSFFHGLLDHPQYTRPEVYQPDQVDLALATSEVEENTLTVPKVLLGGNHGLIRSWRLKQALGQTWLKRPDLLEKRELSEEEEILLAEFKREYE